MLDFGKTTAGRAGFLAAALGAGVIGTAAPARADTFTAMQLSYADAILSQFNLVNLNDYKTTNETEGRIVVGGNATISSGSTNVCVNNCTGNTTAAVDASGKTYGAATIYGNLSGGLNIPRGDLSIGGGTTSGSSYYMNGNGAFNVQGAVSSDTKVFSPSVVREGTSTFAGQVVNANGAVTQTSSAAAFPYASVASTFGDPMKALSSGLAALPGSPGVNAQALPANGNNLFFTALADDVVNGKTYGVITTTLADLASQQNFQGINNGSNDATIVIVTGDGANYTLPNLNSYAGNSKVIFDFVDATTLKFAGTWSGTILAPLASITQQGGDLNGSVVVASLNQTFELHDEGLFTGDLTGLATLNVAVPEPASIGLLALGMVGATVMRRRRRGTTTAA